MAYRPKFARIVAALGALSLAGLHVSPVTAQSRGDYTDHRELPEGVPGERIRELVRVLNVNDPEQVAAFVEASFSEEFRAVAPLEEHQAIFAQVFEQSRGFEIYGIRDYAEAAPSNEVVVIVRSRLTEAWEALVLELEAAPPHRIAGLQVSPARPPSDLAPAATIAADEVVAWLAAFVDRLVDADAFSGAVLLAKDGQVLYRAAAGQASKRFDVANDIDTRFNLGSMNKMFTSVAVLQLVQQGKVKLDDPLGRYLPEGWLSAEVAEKIQVQHLLSHTSGLGSYFNRSYMESSREIFRELVDYKPLIEGDEPQFEPGTGWRYSNTGMFLLGFVIEKASGENYFDFIRRHVYQPAGMTRSDSYDMDRPVTNLAIGYSKREGEWHNNLYQHVIRGGPAGGGFSTVGDLFAFAQALRQHQLLDREHTELLLSPKPALGSEDYGFGFSIDGTTDDRIVGHGGGFTGISANLDIFLDSGYDAVVLSNYSQGATPIREKMRELIAPAEALRDP